MKILICGANGFLGYKVLERTISLDWNADCFVHKFINRINIFAPQINKLIYNIDDIKDIYDIVFLLSSKINYNENEKLTLIDGNVMFISEVVKRCSKAHIVYSSSVSVYAATNKILTEFSSTEFLNSYGMTKFCGELIVRLSNSFTCIRFSSLLGEGMNSTTFLPMIIKKAKELGIIELYGNGSRKQNYLSVNDSVDYCLQAAILKAQGIFLGVHSKEYSNTAIAEMVKSYISNTQIKYRGEDNTPSFSYNNEYSRNVLNKHNFVSIQDVIKNMIL